MPFSTNFILKIVSRKACKNPKKILFKNDKVIYTILSCCNAMGEFLPMNIILKGKKFYSNWCINGPKNATYDVSESGWMEGTQFSRWFKLVFISFIAELEVLKIY